MRAVCAPKCLEKDAHADFLCLHCYPNAVGDNAWAYDGSDRLFPLTAIFLTEAPNGNSSTRVGESLHGGKTDPLPLL